MAARAGHTTVRTPSPAADQRIDMEILKEAIRISSDFVIRLPRRGHRDKL